MAKRNKKTKKKNLILGALIGGALGMGAVVAYRAAKKRLPNKKAAFHWIEHALLQMGSQAAGHLKNPRGLILDIDKKVKKGESKLENILELTAAGIQLWKKIKKEG